MVLRTRLSFVLIRMVGLVHLSLMMTLPDRRSNMIIGNKNDTLLKKKRQAANKFNVLWFKNYDGTCTLKIVTREQYNRMMGRA